MRINPPTAVLATIAAAFVCLAWMHQRSELKLEEARCDVAVAYAKHLIGERRGKPPYFVADWKGNLDRIDIDKFLATPVGQRFRDDPLVPLARQQQLILGQNPVGRCSDVRAFLTDQHVQYGNLDDRGFALAPQGFEYIGLTMPAVDLTHGSAMFDAERVSGPLAGEGFSVIMRRDKAGHWSVQSEDRTWIS